MLTPADSFLRRQRPGPGRAMWMAGVPVALSTGCGPASAAVVRMSFVIALGVLEMGPHPRPSAVECYPRRRSRTRGAGQGVDRVRASADLVILDADDPAHIAYRPDDALVWKVFKNGDSSPHEGNCD